MTGPRRIDTDFLALPRHALADAALMINCEHIAPTQFVAFNTELRLTNTVTPRRWWVHGSQQLLDLTLDAYRTFGVSVIGEMDGRATGEMMSIKTASRSWGTATAAGLP